MRKNDILLFMAFLLLGCTQRAAPEKPVLNKGSKEVYHKADKLILQMDFNEGEGDLARDSAGEFVGHIINPIWVKTENGYGLRFSGASYVRIKDQSLLRPDRFRIEASIILERKINSLPGIYQTIVSKESDYILRFWHGHDEMGSGRGMSAIFFGMGINHANAYFPGFNYNRSSGYPGHSPSDISIEPGNKYQIEMKYDGEFLTATINGKTVSSTRIKAKRSHSRHDLFIGSHVGGRDRFYGIIDYVKIWELGPAQKVASR